MNKHSTDANVASFTVGYYFSAKKDKTLRKSGYLMDGIVEGVRFVNMHMDEINIDDLPEISPWDVILHKAICDINKDDTYSKQRIAKFKAIQAKYPKVHCVDSLLACETLLSRKYMVDTIGQCAMSFTYGDKEIRASSPPAILVEVGEDITVALSKSTLRFPLICKCNFGSGVPDSHVMSIVLSEEGLTSLKPPIILQEYLNHYSTVHKVYVLGETYHISSRPSIESIDISNNDYGETKIITFDSQKAYPSLTSSNSTSSSIGSYSAGIIKKKLPITPSDLEESGFLKKYTNELGSKFGLSLYGYDIIVVEDSTDFDIAIVDVNYFPSFKEYPNFNQSLRNYLKSKV